MEQVRHVSHWWPTFGVMLGALTVALNIGVLNIATCVLSAWPRQTAGAGGENPVGATFL